MSTTIYGLLLAPKSEIKRVKLCDTRSAGKKCLTMDILQTIVKKKTPLSQLGTYQYGAITLTLFGYTTGKSGTENKHELPPPLNESQYYSDILLIASKKNTTWETPIQFTSEQYEAFYQKAFGGEDDEDEDAEEDAEEDVEEDAEEDIEEEIITSVKKKVAEEDGIPEDEEVAIEDEEEGEEEEEEEEEDEEEDAILDEGIIEDEYQEEVAPVKARTSKKKAVKTNFTVIQNTGRAKQQTLMMQGELQQITTVEPITSDTSTNEYKFRTHVLQQIERLLGTVFPSSTDQEALEKSIFQNALLDANKKHVVKHFENSLFHICYMNAARRILSNLDSNSYVGNKELKEKILQGDLKIEHLGTMSPTDYAPSLYVGIRDRMLLREQQQLEGNKAMATDMFRCGRCHKREATFYELQTRSADEPMTKFITCVNCGNHWKQ